MTNDAYHDHTVYSVKIAGFMDIFVENVVEGLEVAQG
jgi:hypothetical protein